MVNSLFQSVELWFFNSWVFSSSLLVIIFPYLLYYIAVPFLLISFFSKIQGNFLNFRYVRSYIPLGYIISKLVPFLKRLYFFSFIHCKKLFTNEMINFLINHLGIISCNTRNNKLLFYLRTKKSIP